MRKSIGKKVIGMMAVIGGFLILICALNISALSIMENQNQTIAQRVEELETAAQSGDVELMNQAKEDIDYILGKSALKINGTYVFNVVVVLSSWYSLQSEPLRILQKMPVNALQES